MPRGRPARRTLLAASVLLLLAGSVATAHQPLGRQVSAFQFPAGLEPVVDGHLQEWQLAGAPTLTSADFVDLVAGAEADAADMDLQVWIGWSPVADRIYVAARVADDIHQVDRPAGSAATRIFQDDDMEVFVDGDHSGGQYADFGDLSPAQQLAMNGSQASHFVLAGPHADGEYFVNFSAAGWYALEDGPYTSAALRREGGAGSRAVVHYELSLAVFDEINMSADFLSRPHRLVEGQVIGFNLEFTDFDQRSELLDAKWSLSGGHNAFRLSERFSDLLLSGLDDRFLPTPVRASTWGQIKSTFAPSETLY